MRMEEMHVFRQAERRRVGRLPQIPQVPLRRRKVRVLPSRQPEPKRLGWSGFVDPHPGEEHFSVEGGGKRKKLSPQTSEVESRFPPCRQQAIGQPTHALDTAAFFQLIFPPPSPSTERAML